MIILEQSKETYNIMDKNIFGSDNPYHTHFPIGILENNNDINRKLIVQNILTKLITKKSDFRIVKGPNNSETRAEKYIGLCGISPDTLSGSLSLVTSEVTSLFTIEPTVRYNDAIDTLRGIISGRDEFRIVRSTNNDHNSTGTYLSLGSYSACQTPSCVMIDKATYLKRASQDAVTSVEARKQDRTRFSMAVEELKDRSNQDTDEDITIFQVFTGQRNIRIKKGKHNFPSARGSFLGLCDKKIDSTPCKTPQLALIDDTNSSRFRIHAIDLFNVACCLKDTKDTVACGLYFGSSKQCDPIVKEYCNAMKTKNNPSCSCMFSKITKPACFDKTCKNFGYKPYEINKDSDDCGINDTICYELRQQLDNPDLDQDLYTAACGNYTTKSYTDYVFDKYWIPILLIIGLAAVAIGLFNYDYESNKKSKK